MTKNKLTPPETSSRTSAIELFFDLVFVVGITQIVRLLSLDHSAVGIARGALILALLWWAWSDNTWTTNWTGTDKAETKFALLGAMGAALLVARAVPTAYLDDHGLWFAIPYLILRLFGQAVYWIGARDEYEQRAPLRTYLPLANVGPLLVLAGGFLDDPIRTWIWLGAVVLDVGGTLWAGGASSEVKPSHFAERHGFLVAIAVGLSIGSTGLRAVREEPTVSLVLALVFTFVAAAALWWAYFDRAAPDAQRFLEEASDGERGRFARDSYTLMHFPIVAGIVLFAVGADEIVNHPLRRLDAFERYSLAVGAALVLLAAAAAAYKATRRMPSERLGGALLLLILAAGGSTLSGRVLSGIAVAILVGVLVSEAGALRTSQTGAKSAQRRRGSKRRRR